MTPEQFQKADAIFQQACARPSAERSAFIALACGEDLALRQRLIKLLRHDQGTTLRVNSPLIGAVRALSEDALREASSTTPPPPIIGGYRILRQVGEGGFGVVYLAEQESPRRTVALKVVRWAAATEDLIRRFEYEAQILGRLRHPAIAQIFEAGMAELPVGSPDSSGRRATARAPFYVMEYIHGKNLLEFADAPGESRHPLSVLTRMELMARVCDGIQHAHQHGVIHRDLKPENILVSAETGNDDQGPQPRILDFGVARPLEADERTDRPRTLAGQLVGTPAYMSPEQILGDSRNVDTRSDVYALGVLLYQLLSGHLPYDVRDKTLPELARTISEQPPAPLRATTIGRIHPDAAAIVHKALAKEKERRYQSAADLAADLRRFIAGETIEARRDSALYVLRKSLWRYRGLVASAVVLVFGLAAFAIFAAMQAREFERISASEQRAHLEAADAARIAQSETAKALLVNDFLRSIFELANPGPGGGYDRTLIDLLNEATTRLAAGALAGQPEVEAKVRMTLARTYGNLDLVDPRLANVNWLLTYERGANGEYTPRYALLLMDQADTYINASRMTEAEAAYRRAFEIAREVDGNDGDVTLQAMDGLGNCLMRQNCNEEALTYNEAVTNVRARKLGDENVDTATARFNLGACYRNMGRATEMMQQYALAGAVIDRRLDDPGLWVRFHRYNARDIYQRFGRLDEAERELRESVEFSTEWLGADHPETLGAIDFLANVYRAQGRLREAAELLYGCFEVYSQVRGSRSTGEAYVTRDLVNALVALKEFDRAEHILTVEINRFIRLAGINDIETVKLLDLAARVDCQH